MTGKIKFLIIALGIELFLTGCGRQMNQAISNFTCTPQNFREIAAAVEAIGFSGGESDSSRNHGYVVRINRRLAQACALPAARRALAIIRRRGGGGMVEETQEFIQGPINAFGLNGSYELLPERSIVREGFPRFKYYVSFNRNYFNETINQLTALQ